jgi:uncharacterized protein YbaR (Trm112 family)
MISSELLQILCCPESHQTLTLADPALIERTNQQIAAGQVHNRGGQVVREPIESGLIREDNQWMYPIRNGIPIMLIDEAIGVGLGNQPNG